MSYIPLLGLGKIYLPVENLASHQEWLGCPKFQSRVFAGGYLLRLLATSPIVGRRNLKGAETGLVHIECLRTTISYVLKIE